MDCTTPSSEWLSVENASNNFDEDFTPFDRSSLLEDKERVALAVFLLFCSEDLDFSASFFFDLLCLVDVLFLDRGFSSFLPEGSLPDSFFVILTVVSRFLDLDDRLLDEPLDRFTSLRLYLEREESLSRLRGDNGDFRLLDDLDRRLRTGERTLLRCSDRDRERRLVDLDRERDLRRADRERERERLLVFSGDLDLRLFVDFFGDRDRLKLFDRDFRFSEDARRFLRFDKSITFVLDRERDRTLGFSDFSLSTVEAA